MEYVGKHVFRLFVRRWDVCSLKGWCVEGLMRWNSCNDYSLHHYGCSGYKHRMKRVQASDERRTSMGWIRFIHGMNQAWLLCIDAFDGETFVRWDFEALMCSTLERQFQIMIQLVSLYWICRGTEDCSCPLQAKRVLSDYWLDDAISRAKGCPQNSCHSNGQQLLLYQCHCLLYSSLCCRNHKGTRPSVVIVPLPRLYIFGQFL